MRAFVLKNGRICTTATVIAGAGVAVGASILLGDAATSVCDEAKVGNEVVGENSSHSWLCACSRMRERQRQCVCVQEREGADAVQMRVRVIVSVSVSVSVSVGVSVR